MARFIFINGAFGAGKTRSTFELHRRLPNSFVFDPEEAGFYIRKCLPDRMRKPNFQDHPEWRNFNNVMLRRLCEHNGTVLVPMTILKREYFRELTDGITDVQHFVITLSPDELKRRQHKRLDGKNSFAARMADECIAAFKRFPKTFPDARLLDCDRLSIEETAERIANECGLQLLPRMKSVERALHRLGVTLKHLR